MQLESLANEVLVEVFEYFNTIDLFRAFHGLNTRFDQLLFNHFLHYNVNFQSVSKHDYDIFCRQHLALILRRVISLRLSNDDETPNLPDHFLHHHFRISQFTGLQFLKLDSFDSIESLRSIILTCYRLPFLTHLKITLPLRFYDHNLNDLIRDIWSVSTLTHCDLHSNSISIISSVASLSLSTSIKYLSMKNVQLSLKNLNWLLACTPCLQYLCATVTCEQGYFESFAVVPLLTRLKLFIDCPLSVLSSTFKMMPNLSHVTLEITHSFDRSYLNGNQWKELVQNCLPNIKVLRFFVRFFCFQEINIEQQIDTSLDTFRSSFWIEEHQWFVRYEWNPQITNQHVSLYTLPYCSDGVYSVDPSIKFKSTSPVVADNEISNNVCQLVSKNETILWQERTSCFFSPKIRSFRVSLSLIGTFGSFIHTLDHLTSLEVALNHKNLLTHLQDLLDRLQHLYWLTIYKAEPSLVTQLQVVHTWLYRVSLLDYYFNASECVAFARSSLGQICKVLCISVTDRRNLPDLIDAMPHLRSLACFCEDNKWGLDESLSSENPDPAKWLRERMPSTYVVSGSMHEGCNVRVWFG